VQRSERFQRSQNKEDQGALKNVSLFRTLISH
jgi:hypothetical protein